METVRAQVYFDTNFPAQQDFLERERMTRVEQCSTLLGEILDVKSKGIDVYERNYKKWLIFVALNRKIVSYVLLRSNIGIPTDMRVIREATGTYLENLT